MAMAEVHRTDRKMHKRFDDFVAKETCLTQQKDGKTFYRPKSHDYCEEFGRITGDLDRIHSAAVEIPRSLLVSLVSQYDSFIRELFRHLLSANRDILRGSHRSLEVGDLLRFGSIEEAFDWAVEREVDEVMRQSHSAQFDFIDTMLAGKWMREKDPLWRSFIELTERRNLFVHTDGLVSNQYLEVCQANGVELDKAVHKGTELKVSTAYFKAAREALLEMGIKVCQVLWRKHLPAESADADDSISDVTYDLLRAGRYSLAKRLLEFAISTLKNKVHAPETVLMLRVNLAIAMKSLDDKKGFAQCMAAEDWSRHPETFQLAEAVLQERYHRAVELMKAVGDQIHKANYRSWPLFKDIRSLPEFQAIFKELFGEDIHQHDHPLPSLQKPGSPEAEAASRSGEPTKTRADSPDEHGSGPQILN